MIYNINDSRNEYVYKCNGVTDNVLISNIVRSFLSGGNDYASMKLSIVGRIGMSQPYSGSGTSSAPYNWFDFNVNSTRVIFLDFSNCTQLAPSIAGGAFSILFNTNYGINVYGLSMTVSNTTTNTIFRVMNTTSGAIFFDNCKFWITAHKDSLVAYRGTFLNCRASIANVTGNSYCFLPNTNGIVRLIGGEFYSYTGQSGSISAVVGQSGTNAVSILYGINAPTSARSGFYQTNSVYQMSGGGFINCTDMVSALPLVVVTGASNVRGTIAYSKPGAM